MASSSSSTAEIVFIPCPVVGHIVPMVEVAKLLVDRDEGLSVTLLVMKLIDNSALKAIIDSVSASSTSNRIRFIELPQPQLPNPSGYSGFTSFIGSIESYKPQVKDTVLGLSETEPRRPLGCFVVDMFCASMIDVAKDIGVASYVFYILSASFLGVKVHLQALQDDQGQDICALIESGAAVELPGFVHPFPLKFLPNEMRDRETSTAFLGLSKKYEEAEGILVNTFEEIDSRAIESMFGNGVRNLYPVGPILNLKGDGGGTESEDVIEWLDDQPPESVVFLCFGSRGYFREDQIRQTAIALEESGYRFLWSLRRPPPEGKISFPASYENPEEVLPEGFLERTAGKGKVIGWAPQTQVLAHPAVGGFVTHCGWNSTLESIWFGVPVAAWPLYAEQHFNAFALVNELGLAMEIRMDYRMGTETVIPAEEIERGIKRMMGTEGEEKREKVKGMSERSRRALMEGGSSYLNLGRFIKDVYSNTSSGQ